MAIGTLDDPGSVAPVIQMALSERLPWVADLASLPAETADERAQSDTHYARIVSFQHPDHETSEWPAR